MKEKGTPMRTSPHQPALGFYHDFQGQLENQVISVLQYVPKVWLPYFPIFPLRNTARLENILHSVGAGGASKQ